MSRDIVARQTFELPRVGLDGSQIGTDVSIECLPQLGQLITKRLNPLPRGLVLVDAGQFEVAQQPLDVVLGLKVGGADIEGVDGVEHGPIQRHLGVEGAGFLRDLFGRLPHRRVRVDRLNQLRLLPHGVQFELHVVEDAQGVLNRAGSLDRGELLEEGSRVGQATVHSRRKCRGVGHSGPERRQRGAGGGRGGWRLGLRPEDRAAGERNGQGSDDIANS